MAIRKQQFSRRQVLGATGAIAATVAAGIPLQATTGAANPGMILRPRPGRVRFLADDGLETSIWGYDGIVPGPLLRVRQGEALTVLLDNKLDQPTTVHWHGIRIDNAMDGVAGLTQEAVRPGEQFTYEFTPPDAGTFWYHPHNRSWEQVARGLYGVLIVDEAIPPVVDQDIVMVIDDWRVGPDLQIDEASLGAMMDWSHAGRLGNFLTVNGRNTPDFPVVAGERLRIRLINTANARTFSLRLEDHAPWIVAVDGQPVVPRQVGAEPILLASGQRVDLMVDMSLSPGGKAALVEATADSRVVAATLSYDPAAVARAHPLDGPVILPTNPVSTFDNMAEAMTVALSIEGGAMGGMASAMYGGRHMDMRELVGHQMLWALNGVAGMAEAPMFEARRDQPVILEMDNATAWPHAMHIHGHHLRDLDSPGGDSAAIWRDTVLIEPGQRMRLGFMADNPGKWLIHCHMLEHQAAGMTTWFGVSAQ